MTETTKLEQQIGKRVAQQRKLTTAEALEALQQTREMFDICQKQIQGLQQMFTRLVGDVENELTKQFQHMDVLMHALEDKELLTQNDMEESYNKYVVKPQEEAMDKHLEDLRQASAQDAYFANVIQKVRDHKWEDMKDDNGNVQTPGVNIKGYFLNALLNVEDREKALEQLRTQFMPDLPEYNPPKEEVEEVEARSMPDCGYCGEEDCEFCSSLAAKED